MSIQEDRVHTLGDILDQAVRHHNSAFDRDNTQMVTTIPLDAAVQRFIDSIHANFAGTVLRGRALAEAMHKEADAIEERCSKLDAAGPDLAEEVENWIKFERSTNERQKFFATLFMKK